MSIEDELPRLLEELADDHTVVPPPMFEDGGVQTTPPNRSRSTLVLVAAVAACSVLLIGGLMTVASRDDDAEPADAATTAPITTLAPHTDSSTPTSGRSATETAARPDLDLIRLDARLSEEGTTGLVLVFDGDVPDGDVELVEDVAAPNSDGVGFTTQSSDGQSILVCGSTHSFPPPANRTVDIFVPSEWFGPAAVINPPIDWEPDGVGPSKIVVCEPRDGVVQVSVWGSASARLEDVDVRVDARTITVNITPDPIVSETGAGDAVDGPVMRHPNRSGAQDWPAAEVRGILELEGDCLYVSLDEVGERYPILWPASTTWDAVDQAVDLPLGESVAIGDNVSGGGGYFFIDDVERSAGQEAADLARRCVDNQFGEIAIVNNFDAAIGPD